MDINRTLNAPMQNKPSFGYVEENSSRRYSCLHREGRHADLEHCRFTRNSSPRHLTP